MPVAERRRFHARAGEFGARLEGQSEIHSSLHYERAGLRRLAFDAALAGARDASRLSAHREAFELYRRAIDNMPDDIGPAGRGEILDAYSKEASSIEENVIAEQMGWEASAAFREAGEPVQAIASMEAVIATWRREARPISERLALAESLWAELSALPDDPRSPAVQALLAIYIAIIQTDAGAVTEAREWLGRARELGERIGDADTLMTVDWKEGVVDVVAGDIAVGMTRVGDAAHDAEAAGYEETGVSAFRDAATLAARAMDYAGSDALDQ